MKRFFLKYILGYKLADEDPIKNIPLIGERCLINFSGPSQNAIFKERPENERFSENEFRYYFELEDGSIINIYGGVFWKKLKKI